MIAEKKGMFGLGRKSQADKAFEVLPQAVALASDKWLYFADTLNFKREVGLAQRITLFSEPFYENLRSSFPVLKRSPDAFLLFIVALGVDQSGTHPRDEIERELNIKLPL